MSDLPDGWTDAAIGELVELNPKNACDDELNAGFVPMPLLGTDFRSKTAFTSRRWGDIKKNYTHFADGDVLLAKITPCFENGKAGFVEGMPNGIAAGSSEYFVCRPHDDLLHAKYLLALFKTEAFLKACEAQMSGSVGHKRVPKEVLVKSHIPLAPLPEQKRIADKLDALLARTDACRERLDRIPILLKRFRRSILVAAVSGRLTSDWRAKHSASAHVPLEAAAAGAAGARAEQFQSPVEIGGSGHSVPVEAWTWRLLTDLARLESGHTPRKSVPAYWDGGDVPWLSLQDIRNAHGRTIFETKFMPTMLGIENSSARLLPAGTVCFSRDISVGYATIMGRDMATTQHFANWICGPELLNTYLMYSLMAAKSHLTISGQGSTVKTIYMPALKQFQVLVPPLDEQTEIVRRVDALLALTERLEQRYRTARAQVDKLTPGLIAKAFRGELVPQDANDEPAIALLERSRARLAEAPAKPRRRPSTTSRQHA